MRKPAAICTFQIVAISAAAVAVVPGALAQGTTDADRYFCGPHMMWWTGGWYGMIFGPLFMILGVGRGDRPRRSLCPRAWRTVERPSFNDAPSADTTGHSERELRSRRDR